MPEGVAGANGLNVDKLVARLGLIESVTEAGRKRKAGAVEINGARVTEVAFSTAGLSEILLHVGKQWRRVKL